MGELVSFRGVYSAERAAALSGVPKSTIYYWANKGIYVPSVSPSREKLWSFSDLLALRAVYWLRQDKPVAARTTMKRVRQALREAAQLRVTFGALDLSVDATGEVFYRHPVDQTLRRPGGQTVLEEPLRQLHLLVEYESDGRLGPNLKRPRDHLLILPGKLSGEPHIQGTRIGTAQVAALHRGGFSSADIATLYPVLSQEPQAVDEAISLEQQLALNVRRAV